MGAAKNDTKQTNNLKYKFVELGSSINEKYKTKDQSIGCTGS